ncbi:MAG: EAL domain-containing protein [Myxococcales bacterium]|nr:MAG: EAL domain-containing protein [Myxococcales bacterium]
MVAIAEGVECEEEAHILTEIGCVLLQGYFIGREVPSTETRTL